MRSAASAMTLLLAACGGGADLPASRPSDLATPSATAGAGEIREVLVASCPGGELDTAMEGFEIVALSARFSDLSPEQRESLASREMEYEARRETLSPGCVAAMNKIV